MFDDTRADWGASKPRGALSFVATSARSEFFSHYDGGSPLGLAARPHSACLDRVKQDQAFHMNGNGWTDIGYNGLVCQHGRAIEGRGIDYVGAHCPDHNLTGYGWQFMVGGDESPTPAAYARMRRAYDDCVKRSGPLAKKGHRDGLATACPGDIIYRWIRAGMEALTTQPEGEPMATAAEIADEILKRRVVDYYGNDTTVGAAIGLTLRNSTSAALDARKAVALAEAAALAEAPLTKQDIDDIGNGVVQALGAEYDASVVLTPKGGDPA